MVLLNKTIQYQVSEAGMYSMVNRASLIEPLLKLEHCGLSWNLLLAKINAGIYFAGFELLLKAASPKSSSRMSHLKISSPFTSSSTVFQSLISTNSTWWPSSCRTSGKSELMKDDAGQTMKVNMWRRKMFSSGGLLEWAKQLGEDSIIIPEFCKYIAWLVFHWCKWHCVQIKRCATEPCLWIKLMIGQVSSLGL